MEASPLAIAVLDKVIRYLFAYFVAMRFAKFASLTVSIIHVEEKLSIRLMRIDATTLSFVPSLQEIYEPPAWFTVFAVKACQFRLFDKSILAWNSASTHNTIENPTSTNRMPVQFQVWINTRQSTQERFGWLMAWRHRLS